MCIMSEQYLQFTLNLEKKNTYTNWNSVKFAVVNWIEKGR